MIFYYQAGESCLKSGSYIQVCCSGLFCESRKKIINLSYGEQFPKCGNCGNNAVWAFVNLKQLHPNIKVHPHTHSHVHSHRVRHAG